MNGTVKFFNEMKGFGFIAGEDGKEYFVHTTGLAPGVSLKDNDAVTFDVEEGDRGPKAGNVQLSTGEAAEAPAEEPAAEEAPAEEPAEEEPKESEE
jgi:CspA family cold shock protein